MLKFEVQGRNNYYAIDEYKKGKCNRFVDSFQTRKQANAVASELNRLAEKINELENEIQGMYEDAAGENL